MVIKMKTLALLIALLFLAPPLYAASFRLKLEEGKNPTNTIAGFWYMDVAGKKELINWYEPGHYYCIITTGLKCDLTKPTQAETTNAKKELNTMVQEEADQVELYNESIIKRQDGQTFCVFATFVPDLHGNTMKNYTKPLWKYLGETFSEASIAFGNKAVWQKWWKVDSKTGKAYMDEVIAGWEEKGGSSGLGNN